MNSSSSFLIDNQFHAKIFISIFMFFLVASLISFIFSSDSDFKSLDENFLFTNADESVQVLNSSQYLVSPIEKCDILSGDWVRDSSGPTYTNETCEYIGGHQNCMKNGRPDYDYLYWKWKPKKCNLPAFDVDVFLKLMTNKSWVFIGDSISRNHVQSFMCMLSKVERAVEVYHDESNKSKRWVFPNYNLTVGMIWSPLLMKAGIHEDDEGKSFSDIDLHLDQPDPAWAHTFRDYNYVVLSTGKWFLKYAVYYKNGRVIGCHSCANHNLTSLGPDYAFRESLRHVLGLVGGSAHPGTVFFRTSTPSHFKGGEWWTHGTCNRTRPVKENEVEMEAMDRLLLNIELEEFGRAVGEASLNGVDLRLVDFSRVLLVRPDGHPGPYRFPDPFKGLAENDTAINDCLHWCLPGPIDSLNDLLVHMVLAGQ